MRKRPEAQVPLAMLREHREPRGMGWMVGTCSRGAVCWAASLSLCYPGGKRVVSCLGSATGGPVAVLGSGGMRHEVSAARIRDHHGSQPHVSLFVLPPSPCSAPIPFLPGTPRPPVPIPKGSSSARSIPPPSTHPKTPLSRQPQPQSLHLGHPDPRCSHCFATCGVFELLPGPGGCPHWGRAAGFPSQPALGFPRRWLSWGRLASVGLEPGFV